MRIELMTAESQPAVLPLNYGHHKETHYIQSKGTVVNATHTYRSATVCFLMVGAGGFEPSHSPVKSRILYH